MSDKCFLDTNILVYAHDRAAGLKHKRAREIVEELWTSGLGVLSTQVLQELVVSLRRKTKNPPTTEELRSLVRDYMRWEVVANSADGIIHALDLEVRLKISFWDALILHAADAAGASVIYSEDLAAGHKYGAIRLINPLIA
jgi:predicted nucleic acid-binding protein